MKECNRWVPLVDKELPTLLGAPEFTLDFKCGSCYWIFSFMYSVL